MISPDPGDYWYIKYSPYVVRVIVSDDNMHSILTWSEYGFLWIPREQFVKKRLSLWKRILCLILPEKWFS